LRKTLPLELAANRQPGRIYFGRAFARSHRRHELDTVERASGDRERRANRAVPASDTGDCALRRVDVPNRPTPDRSPHRLPWRPAEPPALTVRLEARGRRQAGCRSGRGRGGIGNTPRSVCPRIVPAPGFTTPGPRGLGESDM